VLVVNFGYPQVLTNRLVDIKQIMRIEMVYFWEQNKRQKFQVWGEINLIITSKKLNKPCLRETSRVVHLDEGHFYYFLIDDFTETKSILFFKII